MSENEKDPREQYANWKAPEEVIDSHELSDETPEETFKRYQSQLALDEKSLVGKRILDVGSNDSLFEQYLEQKYPGTGVVSMDLSKVKGISVQGNSEQLPFKDESFDVIVAHGVPFGPEDLEKSMEQFVRALKENGEIRIGPMSKGENSNIYAKDRWDRVHALIDSLKEKGITIEDVPIGEWQTSEGPETKYCIVVKKS